MHFFDAARGPASPGLNHQLESIRHQHQPNTQTMQQKSANLALFIVIQYARRLQTSSTSKLVVISAVLPSMMLAEQYFS
ncbi:UNVERIFIED_ORG: hypothetical protein HNP28_001527 [Comamonas terrigena]